MRSNYEFQTSLDGVQFIFRLHWNDRVKRWHLTVLNSAGVELISGRKLTADVPFAPHETIDGIPDGQIWILDRTATGVDPGLRDLGERVLLMYVDEDNVA